MERKLTRLLVFVIAFVYSSFSINDLCGQLVYNKGAGIYVVGADVYIQGGLQNDDVGSNQGIIDVSSIGTDKGMITLSTAAGNFTNNIGAELILKNDTYFRLTGNWVNHGSFDAQSGIVGSEVTFNGTAEQSYNHTATATAWKFYKLKVNTPAINLSNDLFIKPGGLLTFDGNGTPTNLINTVNNRVVMEQNNTATAAFAGINSTNNMPGDAYGYNYINGNQRWVITGLGKTSYEFPIGGNGSGSLQYMQLDFTDSPFMAGITQLDAFYEHNLPGVPTPDCGFADSPTVEPYTGTWHYEAGGIENLFTQSYTLIMHPRAYAAPGNNLAITIDHGNGWEYGKDASSICVLPAAPYYLELPGQTQFSKAGGLDVADPLPIELLSFTAQPQQTYIQVAWTTATEINSAYFDLERSLDAQNFAIIKNNIPAKGFSSVPHTYNYPDLKVQYNIPYYYRLKQVDRDGTVQYSNIVSATLIQSNTSSILLYPNPTQGGLNAVLQMTQDTPLDLKIYDATGRIVYSKKFDIKAGNTILPLDEVANQLADGFYQFVFQSNFGIVSKKVTKIN